ncbi:SDR family NAD(P)-dependent oxidoreductase [Nonomuraea sp. GTA35]|uniref:SDR family NAD(P)-dependent oxidoreductase n=1 Tax=Nonomuraea sp. GTA35 TaxID=1676746 RepID=UPI0035C0CAD8
MKKLSGKTALVAGSSRGIGRAVAAGLAREGALVAVHHARSKQAAQETADVVVFLATDQARWITGTFVDATGGSLLGLAGLSRSHGESGSTPCWRAPTARRSC